MLKRVPQVKNISSVPIFINCVCPLNRNTNAEFMFQRAEAIEPMPPQLKINIHFTKSLKRDNIEKCV